MYCPKCSQQQPAEGMRFCSRCGFTLAGVALLLENNGMLPQSLVAPQRGTISRNRILVESTIFTIFAWAVALFAVLWFDAGGPFETVAKIATLVFTVLGLISLMRFLYGFLFVKESAPPAYGTLPRMTTDQTLRNEPGHAALPPQQSVPISDYPLRVNTKEIRPQPSVTENTTKLLDEQ